MYYNDFYDGYSEFDQRIAELKEALASEVKQEYLDKIKELQEEVASLKEFRDKKDEYDEVLRNIKRKEEGLKKEYSTKRLKELIGDFSVPAYTISDSAEFVYPKCDKCDKDRRVKFYSPSGREYTEDCSCAKKICNFSIKEARLVRFGTTCNGQYVFHYYAPQNNMNDYMRSDLDFEYCVNLITRGNKSEWKSFDDINPYRAVFTEKDFCEEYCKYLQDKEEAKIKKMEKNE